MTRQYARTVALVSLILGSSTAMATNIDQIGSLSQQQFRDLSADLGAALSYKAVTPAEPLGTLGFDLGLEVTSTTLKSDALQAASSDNAPSQLVIPKLHLHKGLPFGLNLGAFYTSVPSSNIGLAGAALSYAIVDGGILMPAIAIRGTYSQLTGVDGLELNTKGLELSVSKGFAMATPYAGIGTVRIDSRTNLPGLENESLSQAKKFVGINLNLGLINLAAEAEQTGDNTSTSAKIGLRF